MPTPSRDHGLDRRPLTRRSLLRHAATLAAASTALPLLGACAGGDRAASGAVGTSASDVPASAPSAGGAGGSAGPRTIRTCVYARNHASSALYWQRFAPEGVTVDVAIVESAGGVQQGLENGDFDFGLMGPYNTVAALDTPEGIGSRVVGMISRQGIGLIGSTERGVASVTDLAGMRIAVPPPGVQTLVLTTLLLDQGLDITRDVEAIPLGYADHPTALANGDIDAYVGTEPLCTQSVADGIGQRLPEVYDTPIGDMNTAMWASPAALEDAELVMLATDLQRQAAEYLTPGGENDPEVWHELLVDEFEYDEAIYANVLANIGAEWRFDDARVDQFRGSASLLFEQGVLAREVDVEVLFARDFWR